MSTPVPPTRFSSRAFADRWYRWSDMVDCFWPGRGKRASQIDPELAQIANAGGIYLLAWSRRNPGKPAPTMKPVRYVGETGSFRRRMGQWSDSAGWSCDKRIGGHSAAWRCEELPKDCWIAFFPIPQNREDWQPHLVCGLRKWMEAIAVEAYRQRFGTIPMYNARDGD